MFSFSKFHFSWLWHSYLTCFCKLSDVNPFPYRHFEFIVILVHEVFFIDILKLFDTQSLTCFDLFGFYMNQNYLI